MANEPFFFLELQIAARHWSRILRRWPKDRMRPDWVAVQTVMQKRLDTRLNPSSPSATTSEQAAVDVKQPKKVWDEAKEMQQVNSLYSLLENRYMNENPLPETLRYPQSQPEHYDALLHEFEAAPDRTWLQRLWLKVTGSVRLQ